MGIFSFFSRDTEDEEDEELLQEEEEAVQISPKLPEHAVTGELFEGMRIDVTTKEGELLLTGRVVERSGDSLTLGRLPGDLSFKIVTLNSTVSLNGFDKRLIPICLSAVVAESTRTALKLTDLKVENHAENRESFRLPYTAPVSIFRMDDERMRNPEECTLINISTGGCCIQTEYVHMEDEVMRIRVKLEDYAPLNFVGQVVRCVDRGRGKFWYGILFAQLTEQEIAALNKTLYNLQMGIKQTHMRTEDGHW